MKDDEENKEERLKNQQEAQKRMEEKKNADKAARLKELKDQKEADMLKAAEGPEAHGGKEERRQGSQVEGAKGSEG